ncbi:acyl-CoA dehydrogenase C-terminal domain-containing protein [Microbulbifer hainanensis]|uniref:acyl-CoA dehydrogenase C-terminal domain-containing protein n=1 Tax=Microbulbifer hainanensis TaxID=2735675 RepID=UPI00186654ED|nr:acyl-CoA dehydrogenase C-terminal domain-containing protein [Microbulbifer hainanensis]
MPEYKAPIRDMQFVLHELLNTQSHYEKFGYDDANAEMTDAILSEAAKLTEEVIGPLNRVGDIEGCKWDNGEVTTPTGFKEAYRQYVEGGWPTLSQPLEFGGQGLPFSIAIATSEMVVAANHAFAMYPGLTHGALATLHRHGTAEQQQTYMHKLVEGRWTGTMCLTEPHCGSDLGMLRTKAVPAGDGTYRLKGTKIFISAGEHDMSENIVHIVIARIEGAPAGTRGISLFIVPKFKVNADGSLGERNGVNCGAVEHKMGIKGNATCVLNFDDAEGYLIGPENRGLNCMFTFMNAARVGVALEGVGAAEASYQGALNYAKDRLQMRSLSGAKNPDGPADPIIVHPDVRRMLLTQKAFAESGRAMVYDMSRLVDIVESPRATDEEKADAECQLSFLTPIGKAFLTETGYEATNHGVQVYGGHGFISEWGMEQLVRDTRICCLYEGTTGIQALDLLARKVLGSKGKLLQDYIARQLPLCQSLEGNPELSGFADTLKQHFQEWGELTQSISKFAAENPEEIGAAATDYLMYSGYVVSAAYWLHMATVAQQKLQTGSSETDFYQGKLHTARFYFDRLLPRTRAHAAMIKSGASSLMALPESQFRV